MFIKSFPAFFSCLLVGILFVEAWASDEMIFTQHQPTNTVDNRSLDRSINNLALVDQYYRESLKQNQMLFECNSKVTLLEYEVTRLNANRSSSLAASLASSSAFTGHNELASNSDYVTGNDGGGGGLSNNNNNNNNQTHSINLFIKNLKAQLIEYFK
jgi:hypothetical protein